MAHSGHAQAATHSLLTAIVQCSAYIEGVTPDGLKNLHGKCLEASSQGHARTPSPNATFFQFKSERRMPWATFPLSIAKPVTDVSGPDNLKIGGPEGIQTPDRLLQISF